MTDEEILDALDSQGCALCGGSGDRGYCGGCAGYGVSPKSVLRAVQAIGHLLIDVRYQLAELAEKKP